VIVLALVLLLQLALALQVSTPFSKRISTPSGSTPASSARTTISSPS
jgi:hypothetical protein